MQEIINIKNENIEQAKKVVASFYGNRIPKAYIHSFGCQQNINDGEKIKGIIVACGFSLIDIEDSADLIIYNTCAVREHAQDRVYGNLGNLKHNKSANEDLIIGVCGCMTEQEIIKQKIKKSFSNVNFVLGTNAITTIPAILSTVISTKKKYFSMPLEDIQIHENTPLVRDSSIKAWVPVMYGCDNFCSYCIVPYVRGRERSRKSVDIINEIKELIKDGYKEINLLGQNVNSYGKGLDETIDFADLLQTICNIKGEFVIRFMTSHPKDANKKLIDVMAKNPKICKHLHLPVQSGSNHILKQMNRKYTAEEYIDLIKYAKEKMPDLTLTSDIIVGFPGETEDDFMKTLDLIKEVEYNQLFTFIYSVRQGTKAAGFIDTIPYEQKSKHMAMLLDEQTKIGVKSNQNLVGSIQRVLVDSIGKSDHSFLSSRTSGNILCEFEGSKTLIGTFAEIKITNAKSWAIFGEKI